MKPFLKLSGKLFRDASEDIFNLVDENLLKNQLA
jgi:hypothetical protein